jgi:phosphoribosyl-AMP cyclohydrolase
VDEPGSPRSNPKNRRGPFLVRSRQELWHKGATSGETQKLIEMKVDCDQDCLWITVEMQGKKQAACHTGRHSCFYRIVGKNGKLSFKE